MSLKQRFRQPELMDDPGLDEQSHNNALTGLRRVNWWSRTVSVLEKSIRSQCGDMIRLNKASDTPLRILDIASGGGDMAIQLACRLQRSGINVSAEGCYISSTAISYAAEQALRSGCHNIRFFEHDVLKDELPHASYDVVMCTLFMHHLDEPEAVQLLNVMNHAARHLAMVDDLQRTSLGYGLAWAGCRLLTRCRIVHVDGPLSVQGAFTVDEAEQLAVEAGVQNVKISTHWPERFLMTWRPAS